MTQVVRVDRDGDGVAVLTLNRPQALNAVSIELAEALAAALDDCGADPGTRAVVLTGAGDRAFSAGVDLREASTMEVPRIEEWFGTVCRAYTSILAVDKPVVAALNGLAAGAGFQIALVSDLRVGHPGIRMGQPEINAGLPSVMGSYWMTLHLGWAKNQELSYTGRFMDCAECERLGLLARWWRRTRCPDGRRSLPSNSPPRRRPPSAARRPVSGSSPCGGSRRRSGRDPRAAGGLRARRAPGDHGEISPPPDLRNEEAGRERRAAAGPGRDGRAAGGRTRAAPDRPDSDRIGRSRAEADRTGRSRIEPRRTGSRRA